MRRTDLGRKLPPSSSLSFGLGPARTRSPSIAGPRAPRVGFPTRPLPFRCCFGKRRSDRSPSPHGHISIGLRGCRWYRSGPSSPPSPLSPRFAHALLRFSHYTGREPARACSDRRGEGTPKKVVIAVTGVTVFYRTKRDPGPVLAPIRKGWGHSEEAAQPPNRPITPIILP
jgi:hypothetical protein